MKRLFESGFEDAESHVRAGGDSRHSMNAGESSVAQAGKGARAGADADARTRLLEAALNLFSRRGFEGTSVRELAAAAGVNLAAVNYYFGGKEGLRHQALRYGFMPMAELRLDMEGLLAEVQSKGTMAAAERGVREFVRLFVMNLVVADARCMILYQREKLAPSAAIEEIIREFFTPFGKTLSGIVSVAVPGAPQALVGLSVYSIISQCAHMRDAIPAMKFFSGRDPRNPETLRAITEHIAEFSIQALRGLRKAYARGTQAGGS